jgi:DNA-directed RNA polymerase subunit M/transcription elongation factor TFIIS
VKKEEEAKMCKACRLEPLTDSAEKTRNDEHKRNARSADEPRGAAEFEQPAPARQVAAVGHAKQLAAHTDQPASEPPSQGEKVASSFLVCGACGGREFFKFGPFADSDDPGLRSIYACADCGEQLRVYQTSEPWRQHRALFRALLRQERLAATR